jgi:hypothetical protein
MHVIPPFEAGVTLHRLAGTSEFYPNRRLLVKALGMSVIRHSVGPRLDATVGWYYVILDELRQPIFASGFEPCRPEEPRYQAFRRGLITWNGTGPVPHTGRRRGGNAYRYVHTLPERRANSVIDAEAGEPAARASRRGRSLPSSWDDMVRSDYGDRCWKRHRKHQWKE